MEEHGDEMQQLFCVQVDLRGVFTLRGREQCEGRRRVKERVISEHQRCAEMQQRWDVFGRWQIEVQFCHR